MRNCYLHVGTHKTGSSAIEAFLCAKREELLTRRVLVPAAGMGKTGDHLALARAICRQEAPRKCENIVTNLSDELARYPEHDVVVSSESLEQHFWVREPSELVAFFRSRGYRITLVCFVRPQHTRMNASYAQLVKGFRKNQDFPDYVDWMLTRGLLLYSRWLRITREQSLNLSALPYDGAARRDGVLSSFLRLFGLEDMTPEPTAYRENITIGAAAIAAARTCMDRIAAQGLDLNHRQRVRCLNFLQEADRKYPTPSYCGLAPGLLRRIEDRYWGDNQYFALLAWGKDWADVFGSDNEQFVYNDVARDTETSRGYEQYLAVLNHVWPEVLRIAEDRDSSRQSERELEA